MPRLIERGEPHILRAVIAEAKARLGAAFALAPAHPADAGQPQRALFARHPVNPALVTPTPQRLAVGASMEYAGYTTAPQRVTTAPSLRNADMPAPQLVANPYPAGNVPAIKPTRVRLPVT